MIPAIIAQIFIPITEIVIPAGISTNEANAEIETQPVTVEVKINEFSTWFKYLSALYTFHLSNHYVQFPLKDKFLFLQFFLI